MSRLLELMDKMTSVLNDLKRVLDAEQAQLSAGFVNGVALQRITEEKSSLLATLDYLEQLRRMEQHPHHAAANDDPVELRWQTIKKKTRYLNDLNTHNGWLLEGQLERNKEALEVLRPHQEPGLYGSDGQTAAPNRSGKKFSV
ncbi:flagellar biosynthesis protein FlgN [Mangrovibacter phragmitis]|jgi:flagella synthesis protein FlgN|uniref:Flagellar biosynthesis protein FlgN n=1 Tax=Mangrovibacter phragmitis TaxID=1691903 RepID=A0A1B7KY83_9ENTR|nr:flagella biosynthesis chaperone FlgN [Mangrovibacter phragmitis]OAT75008.1 flagellar biosynthesis protein FlgN [Mangrovibacter phragmitis]